MRCLFMLLYVHISKVTDLEDDERDQVLQVSIEDIVSSLLLYNF